MTSSSRKDLVHPVILSGGSGTRLWPLSRRETPKQLLALAGAASLLEDTTKRMSGAAFAAPMIVCNHAHRFVIAEQLRGAEKTASAIVLEPAGRNTAAAAAVAALIATQADSDALILLAPSDHVVRDVPAFEKAVARAIPAARSGALVTFGITPSAPETGYGYVQRGSGLDATPGVFKVARFVEKPNRETAEAYLKSGDYFWNSGMFLFAAAALLAEMDVFQPAILKACREAVSKGARDTDFVRLDESSFLASPSISLDYAVMEHTKHAAIVPVDMGWSDVGSWAALWDIAEKDSKGNAQRGDVLAIDAANSYLRSDGPLVAAIGVDDLVVVATRDAVLVVPRERSQDVKKIVDELERAGRSEHIRAATDKKTGD